MYVSAPAKPSARPWHEGHLLFHNSAFRRDQTTSAPLAPFASRRETRGERVISEPSAAGVVPPFLFTCPPLSMFERDQKRPAMLDPFAELPGFTCQEQSRRGHRNRALKPLLEKRGSK